MGFRRALQRLHTAKRHLISGLYRGSTQASQTAHQPFKSQKQLSRFSSTWVHQPLPAAATSYLQEHQSCAWRRSLSTSSLLGVEDRTQSPKSGSITLPNQTLDSSSEAAHDRGDSLSEGSSSIDVAVESAYKSSPRHDLAMVFTCTVCETRSAKTLSRATYETGVVIVRCPGCSNLHLIADRYGWFGEKGGVEDFLAAKGIDVRKGSDASYEFTMDDLAGWTPQRKPEKL